MYVCCLPFLYLQAHSPHACRNCTYHRRRLIVYMMNQLLWKHKGRQQSGNSWLCVVCITLQFCTLLLNTILWGGKRTALCFKEDKSNWLSFNGFVYKKNFSFQELLKIPQRCLLQVCRRWKIKDIFFLNLARVTVWQNAFSYDSWVNISFDLKS